MPKPVIHGRDHAPGGADPIPGLGGGGGIQFDTDNQGGFLYVQTNDIDTAGSGVGLCLFDDSGGGIQVQASGGGSVEVRTTGGGDTIIRSTGTVRVQDENTGAGAGVLISSLRSHVTIATGQQLSGTAGYLILDGLPTSDPGVPGAVWNDGGTLKVS
jgi:hypothetical protein